MGQWYTVRCWERAVAEVVTTWVVTIDRWTNIGLYSEDTLFSVAVLVIPVVIEVLFKTILVRVNNLLRIYYWVVEVFLSLCIGQIIIGLCPCKVNLCQGGVSGPTCSTTNIAQTVSTGFGQTFCSILQIVNNLLIYFGFRVAYSILAFGGTRDKGNRTPDLYCVVVPIGTKELGFAYNSWCNGWGHTCRVLLKFLNRIVCTGNGGIDGCPCTYYVVVGAIPCQQTKHTASTIRILTRYSGFCGEVEEVHKRGTHGDIVRIDSIY